MANTYSQLNTHSIFSVMGRENLLSGKIRKELFPYISGILKNSGNYPLAVNGFKDHVHLFFELRPDQSVSSVVEIVKASSSKWLNDNKMLPGKFRWQRGYSAFSYSRSQRDQVIQYVFNQEEHHKVTSFREEYMDILKRFEIEYNGKYLFEFYD